MHGSFLEKKNSIIFETMVRLLEASFYYWMSNNACNKTKNSSNEFSNLHRRCMF